MNAVVKKVAEGRDEYVAVGQELDLPTLPSATNFVTFDAGTPKRADRILESLICNRVFVRKPKVAPLDRYFRVTVGHPDERAVFAERLRDIVREV